MDLVTTHLNADLDGLASMLALWILKGRPGADAMRWVLPGGMDPETHKVYLAHADKLPPLLSQQELRAVLERGPKGRLYVVDTAQPKRIGALGEQLSCFESVETFDTHPPAAADLPRAKLAHAGACAAAMVLQLVQAGACPTPEEAGFMLLGIHQDTGHFTFVSTTAEDHRAAAHCIAWGAPCEWVLRDTPKGLTRDQLAIMEQLAKGCEVLFVGGIKMALLAIELTEFAPNVAVLVEQLREAEGWPVALAVVSWGERALCIGRSQGALDVGALMRELGGGGHPEAASATLRGVTLAEARETLRGGALHVLGEHRSVGDWAAKPVVSLPQSATIQQAADVLFQWRINALPLSADAHANAESQASEDYVGLITRQEVDAALRHGFAQRPAGDFCGPAPAWVAAETPLALVRHALVSGPQRLVLVGTPPKALGVLTRGLALRASPQPMGAGAGPGAKRPPQPQALLAQAQRALAAQWSAVMQLVQLCDTLHMTLCLVGGQVRDLLLVDSRAMPQSCVQALGDVDLVVEGDAQKLARAAVDAFGGALALPPNAFMTARWQPPEGPGIDLASARSEYYAAPAALPQVGHASLNQDLFRRDFTLNAMALGLCRKDAGHLFDPYGGYADLKAGQLRVLHGLSFYDDPTRLLRAVRFAARFDFCLAPDTLGLVRGALKADCLQALTQSRLGAEFDLILDEPHVVQAFRLMRQWGISAALQLEHGGAHALIDSLEVACKARHRLEGSMDVLPAQVDVLWLALAQTLPAAQRRAHSGLIGVGGQALQRFLQGPERIKHALAAFGGQDAHRRNDALSALDATERVCLFAKLTQPAHEAVLLWWEASGRHIRSVVNGRVLLQMGYKEGPAFKAALAAALHAAQDSLDAETQTRLAEVVLAAQPRS